MRLAESTYSVHIHPPLLIPAVTGRIYKTRRPTTAQPQPTMETVASNGRRRQKSFQIPSPPLSLLVWLHLHLASDCARNGRTACGTLHGKRDQQRTCCTQANQKKNVHLHPHCHPTCCMAAMLERVAGECLRQLRPCIRCGPTKHANPRKTACHSACVGQPSHVLQCVKLPLQSALLCPPRRPRGSVCVAIRCEPRHRSRHAGTHSHSTMVMQLRFTSPPSIATCNS